MGGFYLWRRSGDPAADEARLGAAEAQLRAHGFTTMRPIRTGHHSGFHADAVHGGPATFFQDGEDFVAVAGTLLFDGLMGKPALEALLAAFSFPLQQWDRLAGQFALLVHKGGSTHLLTDYFGAFQVFHDPDWRVVSTSFLAAAKSLERLSFDPQGVYEFAFNVFPAGDDTVLAELRRLGPDRQMRLGETAEAVATPKPLPEEAAEMPLEQRIEHHARRLRELASDHAAQFGDRMQCPLSGGFDSRLALALLRNVGVKPRLYVYGSRGESDVDIAQQIADGEGFDLDVLDKETFTEITPDQFPEIVERNFHETDALVTDGGLFDNGGNAFGRHERQRGGQLAVSGGCGEVFRNFFYLPDRPLAARDAMRAFFIRYARGDASDGFDPRAFAHALEAKALAALGRPGLKGRLPRTLIEQLYPRMRCRAFFGREISLVGRHGAYFMPFLDHKLVARALRIPLGLKNAGRFEAALIAHIDPALARYPSSYGHSFDSRPTLSHRLSEAATRMRPPWLRQRSYALRRRLGPVSDDHGGLLDADYLGRVIDLQFPHMRRFFRPENIRDNGLYRRVATLEYLAGHLGPRLA